MGSKRKGIRNVTVLGLGTIIAITTWFLIFATHIVAQDTKFNNQGRQKGNYKKDELLVKFKPNVSTEIRDGIHHKHGSEKIKEFRSLNIHRIKLKKNMDVEKAIALYQAEPDIEYAEPNYLLEIATLPNDSYFNYLWGLYNTGQTGGTPGADIDAPRAWDITTGSNDVAVAIIDTGVDYNHPDLYENMWLNLAESNGAPGIDEDGNGYVDDIRGINTYDHNSNPMDDHGHGTHVAGTIGATGNNVIGVAGINWRIKIIPCKFLGWDGYGYTDGAIECLEYVRALKDQGINIIAANNSWGGGGYSQALYDAIDAQRQSGILFIAAAGNDSNNNDQFDFYPANYFLPNLLSVAATDSNDSKVWFSNYGRRTVHIGAPGTDIVSLRANGTDMYGDGSHLVPAGDPDAKYYRASGTSMAAPHVTGLAGLIKSQAPNRSWKEIKNLILSGGENIIFFGNTIAGRINAFNSLTCISSPVLSALEYPDPFQSGIPTILSALSINCESPIGPVTVTASSGEVINLNDDGIFPDLAANDGIFTASWTPNSGFTSLTFSSPAGTDIVPSLEILTGSLPSGLLNGYYTQTLQASGGTPPFIWSIFSGGVPEGLSLNGSTGEISGTPSATGKSSFTIKVIDSRSSFAMKTFSITIKDVDLTITSVSGPTNSSLGRQISITTTVKNQGSGDSDGFYVSIYLSKDSVIKADDLAITTSYAGTLVSGAERTLTTTATIPTTLTPGSYYLGAIADTGNRIAESNENNNSLAGNQISINSEVDLVITSVSGPTNANPGQEVTFTTTVKNQGSAASGQFYVTIYFSTDPIITIEDIEIRSGFVSGLAAGSQQTLTITSTIPNTLIGAYYIGAIADSRTNVAESNETNNSLVGNQISITTPDLMISSVSGPASASPGQQIGVIATVNNQGGGSSGGFYVSVYLSSDSTITTNDLEIGSVYIDSLGSGAQQTLTINSTIPTTLTGTYYLGAIADSKSNVVESNEGNNSRAGNQISITSGLPDLLISSVSGSGSASPGQQIAVSTTVKDQGSTSSGGFYLSVYLSTDSTITTSDLEIGSVYIDSLGSGAQQTLTINSTIPTTLTGTYYLGAIADSKSNVVELNESNNALAGNQILITTAKPDLVISSFSGPSTASPGQQITMTTTVKNQGSTSAGGFYLSVYLSTDSTITTSDLAIGTKYAGSLAAGTERTLTTTATIPATLTPGTYYLGAIADIGNRIAESNENNNSLAGNQISINSEIDLVITSVSGPANASPGQEVAFTTTVKNQGSASSGSFYVTIYLSTDPIITKEDIEIRSGFVSGLAAGAQQTLTISSTIFINLIGTYYIGAIVDSRSNIFESIENNNSLAGGQITITQ